MMITMLHYYVTIMLENAKSCRYVGCCEAEVGKKKSVMQEQRAEYTVCKNVNAFTNKKV